MIVKTHSGPEALRRFRIRKGWKMASKRHDKVTRTGFRYEMAVYDHRNKFHNETITISRRNDKAVIDGLLRDPLVKRVRIRSLCRCIFAMDPDAYYSQAEIITMESVYID